MKGLKKKISLVLASCMVFSMAGCGSDDKGEKSKKDYINYVYSKDSSFPDVTGDARLNWFSVVGDNLYYCLDNSPEYMGFDDSSEGDATDGAKSSYEFYKSDLNGGSAEKLSEVELAEIEQYITNVYATPNGTVYYTDQVYNDNDECDVSLYKLDGNSFTEVGDFNEVVNGSDMYLSAVYPQDDGSFVAIFGDKIKKLDENLKTVSELPIDLYVESTCLDKNNNIIIVTQKDSEGQQDTASTLRLIVYDAAQNKLGTTYDVDINSYSAIQVTPGFGDYDVMIRTTAGEYGYKYSSGKREKLIDFYGSNISSDAAYNVRMTDKDTVYFSYEIDGDPQKLVRYKKVDPKELENQKVLTVAITGDAYSVKQLVRQFNESQKKYTIQIVDYTEEPDPNSKLGADISAGKVPDIYYVEAGIAGQPIQKYVSKGMVEDLAPFIDKDPDMSMEDFVPSIINSLKIDGKLYYVSPQVACNTLVGPASEIGEESGWTSKEMKDYVESKPDDAMVLELPSKDTLLYDLMMGTGNQFVDWGKGECYFDSDEFKGMLEICGKFPADEDIYMSDDSTSEKIKSGKVLLLDDMVAPEDIQALDKMFGGKVSFKGFPTKEGSGSYFSPSGGLAMSSKCDDKDGAWEFIKTILSKECVGDDYMYTSLIPIREDVFQMKMDSLTTTTEYTDEFGNEITPIDGENSLYGVQVKCKPLADEDITRFRAIVDNTSTVSFYNNAVMDIIKEETAAYFNGDKSLDDVCRIIQDRATTYINENK